jgi:hypothetical protein
MGAGGCKVFSRQARVFKNKHPAVSHGVRCFGKRSLCIDRWAFTKAAQRRITACGAVFQHPAIGVLILD